MESKIENKKLTTEEKLTMLYRLQVIDKEIDKIGILRGELPLEVEDLEAEIEGLSTRIQNYQNDGNSIHEAIANRRNKIKASEALIKKYEGQQSKVRNNREFDALEKEIEFQKLEIELAQKHIREFEAKNESLKKEIKKAEEKLKDKNEDLSLKKQELASIVKETQKDEGVLKEQASEYNKKIEERLIKAYKRIRSNAINGIAVATIQRDACGGCFNKIPPQRKLDIRTRKQIIICEYCGRILVDTDLALTIEQEFKKN